MSTFATPKSWTTAGTADAVAVPRRHLVAITILMCVPLPLLSLAAMVVPLPQIVERAASTFISIAALDGDGPLIREKRVAVRPVEIRYGSLEQDASSTMDGRSPRAAWAASAPGSPAQGGFSATSAETDAGGEKSSRTPDRPVARARLAQPDREAILGRKTHPPAQACP